MTIGHNQASFDQIVEENLLRGLYLTQLNALTRCVRDPRMSARHAQVLAEIIERTNVKTGMAYPGRARLANDVTFYVHGEPQRYTERSIGQTISELIECGYIMAAKRAPVGGGRALSHYVTVAPAIEDLQAQIAEWCIKVRGQPKREHPRHWAAADDKTGIVVKNDVEKSDDNAGIDDNAGVATVTGRLLTGKEGGGDLFEAFWQAFPKGRKQAKGEAHTTFKKIVAGKHKVGFATAAELIEGARRYAATKPDPDYTPMPITWLNQGRWMDDVPVAPETPWWEDRAKLAAMTDDRWRKGISEHAGATWPVGVLSPPPGHPQCKVPARIVAELNLTEIYDSRGLKRP